MNGAGNTSRAEAIRWLSIAEKLLTNRDLVGSKSFATRARESDPTLLPAEQILAIVDTLIAGDKRINNQHLDYYSILQIPLNQTHDSELIANQYRRLALLLNPQKNNFPFSDHAFHLVVDAWSVLSNAFRRSVYDKEIGFFLNLNPVAVSSPPPSNSNPIGFMQQSSMMFQSQPQSNPVSSVPSSSRERQTVTFLQDPQPQPMASQQPVTFLGRNQTQPVVNSTILSPDREQQHPFTFGSSSTRGQQHHQVAFVESTRGQQQVTSVESTRGQHQVASVQQQEYVDCTLRCQKCKRAFQAVKIASPPSIIEGQEAYFCCWGFMPLGFSLDIFKKYKGNISSWTPFARMSNKYGGVRKPSAPRVYIDDYEEDVFLGLSESSEESDEDWKGDKKTKKAKVGKRKSKRIRRNKAKIHQSDKGKNVVGSAGENVQDVSATQGGVEMPNVTTAQSSKRGIASNIRRQAGRVAKDVGKLDLNVEFSNEVEEPHAPGMGQGNGAGTGEDGNIEGIEFFEGLDEFLSSLPILNAVGDDKFEFGAVGSLKLLKLLFPASVLTSDASSVRR
ncbi:hypothetical protein K7X08_009007 [Anisodus acutangulus]|uniref:J domain-containing protein n=1 Tax=Anisodus acutangulus TaxID=402998 RepID=A0A9Q1RTN2_9SOLA|nr:hypothetical protein K7X08_009007 [Anisodus acutangulus]